MKNLAALAPAAARMDHEASRAVTAPARYHRRQRGRVLIGLMIAQGVIGLFVALLNPVLGIIIAGLAVVASFFTSLTVTVSGDDVSWHFGPGLVRQRVALAEIGSVGVITLPWYSGIGIHVTPNGVLYNVAAGPVVQIERRDGTRINVGTPEPSVLSEAITSALGSTTAPPLSTAHTPGLPWPLASAVLVAGCAAVLALVTLWSGWQPVATSVAGGLVTVRGAGYSTSVVTSAIGSVALVDTLPAVERRTRGLAFRGRLRGHFRLAGLGEATVYVDASRPPFVLMRTNAGPILVNARTPAETRALYDQIRAATGR